MNQSTTSMTRQGSLTSAVTVAIACYNQGRYLANAIRSAMQQTTAPDAILVVDDGSADNTRQVAEQFPEVQYIFQNNAGLSAARNTALRNTSTPYILFLDADDWLAPNALYAALSVLRSSSVAPAFVYGGYHEAAEDGTILATHKPLRAADPFHSLLRGNYIAMHGTVVYDAAVLSSEGGFDVTLNACEDYDVYLRLTRQFEIASYDEIGAFYRRHAMSLSNNRIQMIETVLRVINRHCRLGQPSLLAHDAAEEGRGVMTQYYLKQLFLDFRRNHSRSRALFVTVITVARSPLLVCQLARWAAKRRTRAVTITG